MWLPHEKVLQPLLVIPDVHDNVIPPLSACLPSPKAVFHCGQHLRECHKQSRVVDTMCATHSLRYFHTAVSDPEPGLPAYVSVGYLDDNLFVECDSDSGRYKPRAQWIKDNVGADYWERGTKRGIAQVQAFGIGMRILMERYNQTGGFHTLQRRSGCEIREDGSIGGSRQLAYDGDDFISFDMNTYTWVAAVKEAEITQRRWNEDTADLQYRKQYTEKGCIEWLRKYQQYGKEALQGREPAAVEVLGKATPDGLTRLSCRVYGFYPRDIAVTWMKNGEMREQETQRGDILPSGDGTYQIQATLEIDPKEGGRYSCLVDHNSLTKPLNVFWGEERAECLSGRGGGEYTEGRGGLGNMVPGNCRKTPIST
uniref:Ig-like domain-containing protein n=1 Tax=Chrysemys picta bellii TaxID=8478 RepID=A0A8C3HLK2_CHRPI